MNSINEHEHEHLKRYTGIILVVQNVKSKRCERSIQVNRIFDL